MMYPQEYFAGHGSSFINNQTSWQSSFGMGKCEIDGKSKSKIDTHNQLGIYANPTLVAVLSPLSPLVPKAKQQI